MLLDGYFIRFSLCIQLIGQLFNSIPCARRKHKNILPILRMLESTDVILQWVLMDKIYFEVFSLCYCTHQQNYGLETLRGMVEVFIKWRQSFFAGKSGILKITQVIYLAL